MATLKIEVDLDWIPEDGNIDDIIKGEVIEGLQASFLKRAEKKMQELLDEKLREAADKVSGEFLEKVMSEKVTNIQIPFKESKWDSEVKMLSLSEFVGMKYEKFLNKKVFDHDGNIPRYESDAKFTIHEYFTNKFLEKELVGKVEKLIANARQEAEETIIKTLESNLKAQLSADIINRLNIPQMLKSLQEKAAMLEEGRE